MLSSWWRSERVTVWMLMMWTFSLSRVLPSLLQVLLTTPPGECCHVRISLSDAGVNSKNPSELFPVWSSGGRTAASLSELRQLLENVAPLSFAAAKVLAEFEIFWLHRLETCPGKLLECLQQQVRGS